MISKQHQQRHTTGEVIALGILRSGGHLRRERNSAALCCTRRKEVNPTEGLRDHQNTFARSTVTDLMKERSAEVRR